jgi:hypothetical protein
MQEGLKTAVEGNPHEQNTIGRTERKQNFRYVFFSWLYVPPIYTTEYRLGSTKKVACAEAWPTERGAGRAEDWPERAHSTAPTAHPRYGRCWEGGTLEPRKTEVWFDWSFFAAYAQCGKLQLSAGHLFPRGEQEEGAIRFSNKPSRALPLSSARGRFLYKGGSCKRAAFNKTLMSGASRESAAAEIAEAAVSFG